MVAKNILTSVHGSKLGISDDGSLICLGQQVTQGNFSPAGKVAAHMDFPALGNNPSTQSIFFDDFLQQASATGSEYDVYTDMNDGATGTNAFQDANGGWLNVVTAAAADDYHGIRTLAKPWLFAAGKELWLEARFRVSEGTTNQSGYVIGLMDTFTTGGIQAGTAGPLASFSGAIFYKNSTSMAMNFLTSNSTTQNKTTGIGTVVTNQITKVLFHCDGGLIANSATIGVVTPFLDIGDGNGWVKGTAQNITFAALNQMALVASIKAGSGAAAETLQLDYLKVNATR